MRKSLAAIVAVCVIALWYGLASSQTTQYTPNLNLALPPAVPGTWGAAYNQNFVILDGAIAGVSIPRVTVATKPTSPITNQVIVVTDALNAGTCTVGGGTSNNTCQWNGSAWVVIGGGTGGGVTDFSGLTGTASDAQIPNLNILSTGLTNSRCVETDGAGHLSSSGAGCAGITATVVQTNQSNTYTTGDQNMAAASSFTPPTATGATPTTGGRIAYNSTHPAGVSGRLVYGIGGSTFVFAHTGEIQPLSANLTALAGLTGAANTSPIFTGAGAMSLLTWIPCADTGGQHLNTVSVNPPVLGCGTSSTGGITGLTGGNIPQASSATTIGNSIMSQSGGNINIAGGLIVGSGPSLIWNTSAITADRTITTLDAGATGTLRLSTGVLTPGNVVTTNATGQLIDGGAAGGGTWTDSSTNTGTNKTLVATGAGGTNTLTIPIAPYWPSGSLILPSTSTCTLGAVAAINSGPSVDAVVCTDASTSVLEGNLTLKQAITTVTFTLTVNDVDSSSHVFGGDFSAMCRASGTTVNSTWGTSQSVAITMTTANNDYTGTTSAVTPNGTCSAGATLFWRFVVNTATFTDDGDGRVIGVLMQQIS